MIKVIATSHKAGTVMRIDSDYRVVWVFPAKFISHNGWAKNLKQRRQPPGREGVGPEASCPRNPPATPDNDDHEPDSAA